MEAQHPSLHFVLLPPFGSPSLCLGVRKWEVGWGKKMASHDPSWLSLYFNLTLGLGLETRICTKSTLAILGRTGSVPASTLSSGTWVAQQPFLDSHIHTLILKKKKKTINPKPQAHARAWKMKLGSLDLFVCSFSGSTRIKPLLCFWSLLMSFTGMLGTMAKLSYLGPPEPRLLSLNSRLQYLVALICISFLLLQFKLVLEGCLYFLFRDFCPAPPPPHWITSLLSLSYWILGAVCEMQSD